MPPQVTQVELPLIHIKWVDSCHVSGWMSVKDCARNYLKEELTQETAGFLLRETEYSVIIVQSKGFYWSVPNEDFAIDSIMEIPRQAILEITYLTKKKNAKINSERKEDSSSGRGRQAKEPLSKKR